MDAVLMTATRQTLHSEGVLEALYEPEVTAAIERIVEPGDYCVDAGASIGYFTCLLSRLVGPKGLVLAVEPNLPSFEYLEENIAARGLKNVSTWRGALWREDLPAIKMHSVERLGYTSVLTYHSTTYTEVVEARKLDSILLPGLPPDFLKIDCESAEFEILQGAERILRSGVKGVILEFNYGLMRQQELSDKRIRSFLKDLGYDMFLISIGSPEAGYRDPIMVDLGTEIRVGGSLMHVNVLFSTEELVREKWRICDTSKSLQSSAESYKNSCLNITESAPA